MTPRRLIPFLAGAALVALTALSVAACGSGGGASASTPPPAASKTANARPITVRIANTHLGRILVDSQGRTLYLFKKDSGKKSACFGACASFWPPLRANGKPTVGSGARASMVGSISRSDGRPQATYGGHPLYRFAKDGKPGDTKGEGLTAFGGRWFALSAAGKQVSPRPSKSAGGAGTAPPAPKPPQPAAPPAPKPPPSHSNGIPQNGGGDGDSDNNGGPDDGDGGV